MTETARGGAIVTGGAGGIGAEVARRFAAAGYGVVLSDRGVSVSGENPGPDAADSVVGEIRESGGRAVAHHGSVADFRVGEELVELACAEFGHLAALVTCHGILRERMIFNMTEEEWDSVVDVHLKGTFNCLRFATARMRAQRDGSIVTMTSASGLEGSPAQANYAAAKAGIVGLTTSTALAMGRYQVNVNCISPAAATRMTDRISDRMTNTRPAGERGGPGLIGALAVALADPRLRRVTGQVFTAADNRLARWAPTQEVESVRIEGSPTAERVREAVRDRLGVQPPRRFAALGLALPASDDRDAS